MVYFQESCVYIHYDRTKGVVNLGFTIYVADHCWFCHVSSYKKDLSSEMLCLHSHWTKEAWRLRESEAG